MERPPHPTGARYLDSSSPPAHRHAGVTVGSMDSSQASSKSGGHSHLPCLASSRSSRSSRRSRSRNRRAGASRCQQEQELGISTSLSPIAPSYGLNTEGNGQQCLEEEESRWLVDSSSLPVVSPASARRDSRGGD